MKDLDFAFYSDVGGRANNEDSYLAIRIAGGFLFVVADGLGGHNDGEVASRAAITALNKYFAEFDIDVEAAIKYANTAVIESQSKLNSKMKTTVAVAFVGEAKTVIAHVGDTRAYAFNKGKIIFQTLDHSASQLAVSVGEINSDEIRSHTDRNVLTRALGASENVKPDIKVIDNNDYDALLLCSDGFWEYVLENEMESTFNTSGGADTWLYQMLMTKQSRTPQKCDNHTAIAIRP